VDTLNIMQGINSEPSRHRGRPRGSGLVLMDWARYEDLTFAGLSLEAIAVQLGMSRRTLSRRTKDTNHDRVPQDVQPQ
jgi:AraC-like DNA-binding protein